MDISGKTAIVTGAASGIGLGRRFGWCVHAGRSYCLEVAMTAAYVVRDRRRKHL
jgi:hypothetical protein